MTSGWSHCGLQGRDLPNEEAHRTSGGDSVYYGQRRLGQFPLWQIRRGLRKNRYGRPILKYMLFMRCIHYFDQAAKLQGHIHENGSPLKTFLCGPAPRS